MLKRFLIIITAASGLAASPLTAAAQEPAPEPADSLQQTAETPKRRNIFQKIVDYVAAANDPKPAKKFDFSILGGPHYTQNTSFGIGVLAAGIFRRDTTDLSKPPGQVSIYGDISVTGYFKVGVEGSNYFFGDKARLYYDIFFASRPDHYWGIGYSMNSNDDNDVEYKQWKSQLHSSLLFPVFDPNFYFGPVIQLDYIDAKNRPDPALWRNQKARTFTAALGVVLAFDTRDNLYNAYKGVYARIDQLFAPKFFGNQYAFTLTEATFSHYVQAWKGAVIASRLHARFTYGNTPWGMMSGLGGNKNMRGYWENRYNDKCAADLTVEIRQHLFSRIGMVAWGGVGEVFPKVSDIFRSHILWNAGIGVRWEFKHRVNIRVDYGFGQHQSGLVFSINEAF